MAANCLIAEKSNQPAGLIAYCKVPVVKTMGLTSAKVCSTSVAAPKPPTRKQVDIRVSTAASPADHRRVAQYYLARADALDAQAVRCEEAAGSLQLNPLASNSAPSGISNKYRFLAHRLHEESKANRALA